MFADNLIATFDKGLRALFAPAQSQRPVPRSELPKQALNPDQKRVSGALMRVNHSGEICAQALYQGQALATRSPALKHTLALAADEEMDHLNWCENRLHDLGAHKSFLNPLWYSGSFAIGFLSGALGDKWNLGFLAETERQVEKHLEGHLSRLPVEDTESRAIVEQMKIDESKHATTAIEQGAAELPPVFVQLMRASARIMTKTSYWV